VRVEDTPPDDNASWQALTRKLLLLLLLLLLEVWPQTTHCHWCAGCTS
jgi:hypothetical protein